MFGSSLATFPSAPRADYGPNPPKTTAPLAGYESNPPKAQYTIPRGNKAPRTATAIATPGTPMIGYVLTKTFAKMNGVRGNCIALVVEGRIVRPCMPKYLKSCAPFWPKVDDMLIGSAVQITPVDPAAVSWPVEYPHASDDVEVEGLVAMPHMAHITHEELYKSIVSPSLASAWPDDVWYMETRVRNGSEVPSLVAVKGEITMYGNEDDPDKPARATFVTECGETKTAKVRSTKLSPRLWLWFSCFH